MKKILLTTVALIGLPLAAVAGPFGLPDHQPDGYRDTGCDPAQQVQITNDAGDYLYSNNPSCPNVGGSASMTDALAAIDALYGIDDDEEDEEEPDDDNGPKSSDDTEFVGGVGW